MSDQKPTVVIADDHPILLKGLQEFLGELGLDIVGKAKDGQAALDLITTLNPKLAIIDMEMPYRTGLEIATECKTLGLDTKVILLTLHKELYLYHQAKELNLSGYILKEFALEDLSKAVSIVLEGGQFFSEKIFEGMKENKFQTEETPLTPSEVKILRLIAVGLSTKDIASKLFISERTVDKHRSNMITKLQLEKKHNSLLIWAQKNREIID
ncbi:DNA-binding response regulator, NarL/FixJ family, contains REC and HTH domains [Algoriphagus locisalis]|uniref:DNA-binding response regulator, NarL/FixJ family, contains REC and HTH domains n=1 Tax=Algoriphagus locisalis TaxID=305507 RepID=A0A1I7AHR7_9BACT|nr:response regulator transcription factor [Algoriphagus locisalis]SFT74502.1 DNA-binding response regulator, NarL/FixJ family, contains REC and HTH domains [Algoriphagus locisalis]